MKNRLSVGLLLLVAGANVASAQDSPRVTIQNPGGTIIGTPGDVESFASVPFAKPPVGPLRLRAPQSLSEPLGEYHATHEPFACPQFFFQVDEYPLFAAALGQLLNAAPLQNAVGESEDCLYLNIYRPKGTKACDNLPVLFWIFAGGFEFGWNSMYSPAGPQWVSASVEQGQPIIFITVNYRVGGFGFMPGSETKKEGSGNAGLLDQRLALEWVSDNIEAFGG